MREGKLTLPQEQEPGAQVHEEHEQLELPQPPIVDDEGVWWWCWFGEEVVSR